MSTELGKSSVYVQSNQLVEARYTLSVAEQRLILAVTSMIHREDTDFFPYKIHMKDMALCLDVDLANTYREAHKITDKLLERVVQIPQADGSLLKTHWVTDVVQNEGEITFYFSPNLKPYLIQLKEQFTKLNLQIVSQFQSIYSIRIYQLLKQYEKIGHRKLEVTELRAILGIKPEKYKAFKQFRQWILNQAKKEFEKKNSQGHYMCDLSFDIVTIRSGRFIKWVDLIIKKQSYQRNLPFTNQSPASTGVENNQLFKTLQTEFRITGQKTTELINTHSEERLENAFEYVRLIQDEGGIRENLAGFTIAIIEDGDPINIKKEVSEKKRKISNKNRKKQLETENKEKEALKRKFNKDLNDRAQQIYNKTSKTEQDKTLQKFLLNTDNVVVQFYEKDGIENHMVASMFSTFLVGEFLKEEQDFDKYYKELSR